MRREKIIEKEGFKEIDHVFSNPLDVIYNQQQISIYNKTFYYYDEFLLDTGITLKARYYISIKDIGEHISLYQGKRIIFEGVFKTRKEFRTLLKLLKIK
jgi:hypothetical protein